MNIDSPAGQNLIAKRSIIIGIVASSVAYLLDNRWLSYGICFGLSLMLLNWRALSKTIRIAFGFGSANTAKIAAFLGYYIRFSILVVIMSLVILKTNMDFGVGAFLGFLIPKFAMGTIIMRQTNQEWWLGDFNANDIEKSLSEPEKETELKRLPQAKRNYN